MGQINTMTPELKEYHNTLYLFLSDVQYHNLLHQWTPRMSGLSVCSNYFPVPCQTCVLSVGLKSAYKLLVVKDCYGSFRVLIFFPETSVASGAFLRFLSCVQKNEVRRHVKGEKDEDELY